MSNEELARAWDEGVAEGIESLYKGRARKVNPYVTPQPTVESRLREAVKDACAEFRDTILHERHSLEGEGFRSEQINAVLSEFDSTVLAALADEPEVKP